MNIGYAVRDFFFPPICPGCREVFRAKYGEKNQLCPSCERKWELLEANICAECGQRYSDCRCAPKALGSAGVTVLVKLVPYLKKRAVSNNVVLFIKKRRDDRIFDFLSDKLSRELLRAIEKIGVRKEDIVLTFCPRKLKSVNEYGFDQARLLAEKIAKKSGLEFRVLIKRRIGGRAQKKLDAKKREKNIKGAFYLKKDTVLKGKTVVIVDDLVTTGSTMGECVRVLKKGGAALILGACVAYTDKG